MTIIKNNIIPFGTYVAITIGPWIFTRRDPKTITPVTVNHEAIHWEQEKELAIIGFYILYVLMFLWELIRCTFNRARGARADGRHRSTWKRAYRSISFEREAYAHEIDEEYITTRKHFAWIRNSFSSVLVHN